MQPVSRELSDPVIGETFAHLSFLNDHCIQSLRSSFGHTVVQSGTFLSLHLRDQCPPQCFQWTRRSASGTGGRTCHINWWRIRHLVIEKALCSNLPKFFHFLTIGRVDLVLQFLSVFKKKLIDISDVSCEWVSCLQQDFASQPLHIDEWLREIHLVDEAKHTAPFRAEHSKLLVLVLWAV